MTVAPENRQALTADPAATYPQSAGRHCRPGRKLGSGPVSGAGSMTTTRTGSMSYASVAKSPGAATACRPVPGAGSTARKTPVRSRAPPLLWPAVRIWIYGRHWAVPNSTRTSRRAHSAVASRIEQDLRQHGASFFDQIQSRSGLLKTQLEEGLAELVSAGRISSDSFTGLRGLLTPNHKKPRAHRRRGRRAMFGVEDAGRWSLLDTFQQGFSQEGFSQQGLSQQGLSQQGLSQQGLSQQGFSQQGSSRQRLLPARLLARRRLAPLAGTR